MTEEELKATHKYSYANKESVLSSKECGCFYCSRTFNPNEIVEWVRDHKPTAICPYCGIDSVIGDNSVSITKDLLKEMYDYFFRIKL